jgi:hypothetical protein
MFDSIYSCCARITFSIKRKIIFFQEIESKTRKIELAAQKHEKEKANKKKPTEKSKV